MYIIDAKKLFQICFTILVGIYVYYMIYLYTKRGNMPSVRDEEEYKRQDL